MTWRAPRSVGRLLHIVTGAKCSASATHDDDMDIRIDIRKLDRIVKLVDHSAGECIALFRSVEPDPCDMPLLHAFDLVGIFHMYSRRGLLGAPAAKLVTS